MTMKSVAAGAAMAFALSGATALAQTSGSSQGRSPEPAPAAQAPRETPGQPPAPSNAADSQAFVREAAMGGMAEVELGRLAEERAGSDEVKQFAKQMVSDHGKASDELKVLAQKKGITLPTALDAPHEQTKGRLSKLNGAAFDRAYMDAMRTDHRKDVSEFRQQSRSGNDADVKAFAAKTLPTIEAHMQLAERTHALVGTSGRSDKAEKPAGTSGTPASPGAPGPIPGTPGPGSTDPRNAPGSVPGTGIQR